MARARWLWAAISLVVLLVACGSGAWEQDPAVQAAKKDCKGPDESEGYACIERHAVESLNPDICRLVGIWIDDMCLQAVYEAAGDPAICERLYLEGVRPTCRAYYAARLAPPQTPLPPEPLPAFLVEVFPEPEAVLSLDEYIDPAWRPGRPGVQEVPGSVCVEVDASSLLARGDFWEATDVQERTTVHVDGRRQELITAFVDHMLLHAIVDPPDDPSGTVVASVGGPYHLCIYAPLQAGIHRVDVSFEKSAGEVVSYAWTFELFDVAPPAPSAVPPTEAPTAIPLPTSTVVTPPAAYATQDAARRTAVAARATASPFPTAGPSTVQAGQPSVATARRDGLSLDVHLPKDTYLAGEGGQAEVTLRNEGSETVFAQGGGSSIAWLAILDERGHEPEAWPWPPLSMPGMPAWPLELSPGQVLTGSLTFQVPPADQALGHTYTLWAGVRFSRPAPDQPRGPDNLWLRLEAGPIPLQVTAPSASQQLQADLQVDRYGWTLQVTDESGRTPLGPFWGVLEAVSYNGAHMRPLEDNASGAWSASLDPYLTQDGAAVAVRAWVAAPGYVTAAAIQTVPGVRTDAATFYMGEPPVPQSYDTLEAAQAATGFPLYQAGSLPAGARMEGVQVDTWASDESYRAEVTQIYRLGSGGRLELAQMVASQPWASFGWGEARYDPEANVVAVGQTAGYAIRRFGGWLLDWKCGDAGLELRAPAGALSLEELVTVAAGVRSPDGTCPPVPTPAPPTASPAPPTQAPPPTPTPVETLPTSYP